MRSTSPERTASRAGGLSIVAMFCGLVLTLLVAVFVVVDQATGDLLTQHIRDAYPAFSPSEVAADQSAIQTYLFATCAVGAAAWLWTAWAVHKRKTWARTATTTVFVLGAGLLFINATAGGEAYAQILPVSYGVVGLLPGVAGLVAVVLLWRGGHERSAARTRGDGATTA